MPEVGNLPLPRKLLERGIEDMVRICDARMSGTAYGAVTARLADWRGNRRQPKYTRGYYRLYIETVMQANQGCDLDFLTGASGSIVDRESH